jgi:hypothetical protein
MNMERLLSTAKGLVIKEGDIISSGWLLLVKFSRDLYQLLIQ